MKFDLTVTLGNVLGAISVIASILLAASKLSLKINKMQWKLNIIWKWFSKERGIDDSDSDE